MAVWFWLVLAVVAGWMVQLYVTFKQTSAFNKQILRLRSSGTVSVGVGGRRYRGGRAFVAVAIADDRVADAITLQGFTTFARGRELVALRGVRVNRLAGDRDIDGITRQQREAARQAATLFLQSRTDARPRTRATGSTPTTRTSAAGKGVAGAAR